DDPGDTVENAVIERAIAARGDHRRIDVAHHDMAGLAGAAEEAPRDIAGAARQVEQPLARPRFETRDQLGLPAAMDPAAHQVVHQVVTAGDVIEDVANETCLGVLGHFAKSEIGLARLRGAAMLARHLKKLAQASLLRQTAGPFAIMPELPEVETVVRGLDRALTGKQLERLDLARPDLRSAIPPGLAAHIAGKRIERFSRRAKYILMHFEGGGVVIAHLGMSG